MRSRRGGPVDPRVGLDEEAVDALELGLETAAVLPDADDELLEVRSEPVLVELVAYRSAGAAALGLRVTLLVLVLLVLRVPREEVRAAARGVFGPPLPPARR